MGSYSPKRNLWAACCFGGLYNLRKASNESGLDFPRNELKMDWQNVVWDDAGCPPERAQSILEDCLRKHLHWKGKPGWPSDLENQVGEG